MTLIQQIRIQPIKQAQVIEVSPAWLNLFEFVQKHPYVTFERLEFFNGQPKLASQELKITESIKF